MASSKPTLAKAKVEKKDVVAQAAPKTEAKAAAKTVAKATPAATAKGGPVKGPRGENYVGKKVKLLVKENPKREGSKAFERFAIYKTGMKVEELYAAGLTSADLRYDLAKHYIELA